MHSSMHSPIKTNVLQHKINTKKPKPGLITYYNIRPGNGKDFSYFGVHKFVTHLDTYPLTYSPGTHTGLMSLVDSPAELEAGNMQSAEGKWLGTTDNEDVFLA